MKLIRAEFENFRLLRNLTLDFSTDKTLTVIRAENETGKTTILNGLLWALYGDNALPNEGKDYRLHPIDWDVSNGGQVPISVQVDFETTGLWRSSRGPIETRRQYRIIRSAFETLEGTEWKRISSAVKLAQIQDSGHEFVKYPEAEINDELPSELRDVFFTDGDRALSFIEATVSHTTKRGRVKKAIRSLLGLGVIENALYHVKRTAAEVNKAAKDIGSDEKLTRIATRLEQIDKDMEDRDNKKEEIRSQFAEFDEKLSEVQKAIYTALVKGNREKLERDIKETKQQLKRINNQQAEAIKEHLSLFRSLSLSRDLLAPVLEKSLGKLNSLRDQGKIPQETIPVLEEKLKGTTCICGESLDPNHVDGKHRREHIQCLIDKSQKADELQNSIITLYHQSLSLLPAQITDSESWRAEYAKIFKLRDYLLSLQEEQGQKLSSLEKQLDDIPDIDIQGLRSTEKYYRDQRDRFNADQARLEAQLEGLQNEQSSLSAQLNNFLREQKKGDRILAQREVTQDVQQVLENSYDRITNEELDKVSELMNTIFLEMIGADPEQNAIIQKAEISKDFDILVYGPDNRALNPDRDLNGASRRALTLAFILALTRVSEVKAPNVIDTPLGMMSGYVKRSVLKTAIRESSQLVLFLTRSEIVDCEDILDAEAGRVITLTNPAHYPRMLVNDPQVQERKLLQCLCNHRKECPVCQRRLDLEREIEQTF